MKPIATLMKPLRSVDLNTMTDAPAAIERSDVCAVPAAAVVGEAMVAFVLADAFLEKFGGDSIDEIARHLRRDRRAPALALCGRTQPAPRDDGSMIRPILRYGADVLHAPAEPVGEITADIQQLIDDMIQTMYVAPGIGLAATQVGVALRLFVCDVSSGETPPTCSRSSIRSSSNAKGCSSKRKAASAFPDSTPPLRARPARSSKG